MGRVLIACEFSGVVRRAFRERGHDAWSCDLLPAEDGDEHHFCGDVRAWCDGWKHPPKWSPTEVRDGWDLMIAHPPCTHLAVSGMHWTKRGLRDPQLTEAALAFVRLLMGAPIRRIAIENPISIISSHIRKPDQIVQPYQFGHDASKATCLWLKNLPPLSPTKFVEPRYVCACGYTFAYSLGKYGCANCCGEKTVKLRWANQTDSGQNKLTPSADRWKERSKTYRGIAEAMAEQWT